jgi:hypothetical protein
MQQITRFESQFEKLDFVVEIYSKQDGLIIDILSPNEHLGGLGVGVPYSRENGTASANFHCISFPGHRDAELAGELAQIISKITRMKTIVILGVHIPNISKSQIGKLSLFLKKWFFEIGTDLLSLSSLDSDIKAP